MLELLVTGASRKEIAKQFGVSPRTVHNEVDFLEREGLLQQTEGQIVSDLHPLAIEVMKKHLVLQAASPRPDTTAARAVLREAMKRAATPRRDADDNGLTLERWVSERRQRLIQAA